MNWVDFAIIGIILLSVIIGLWRGFVQEMLSLVGWVLAVWVTITFNEPLEQWLQPQIETPILRTALAMGLLFFGVLLLSTLVNFFLARLIGRAGLSKVNRTVGLAFGVARGVLLITVAVLLAGLTNVPRESWWHQSMLVPHFQELALWSSQWLPIGITHNLHY